ncbi:SigE family RNA polymerase sigma factor [Actinoalloteichus sp. AHMU CJ021]|uniref:RNA polymerase sigma-70 factor, sigma-E family n=1 Tax=Actinoalloteichus caeruleus DSM 43889 TaxID=1120930 RepID=A0ABT1JIC6_ACTCY|nr:SigE family RNA polymerase sigma factor [Actinoalloteichus caeruleus]AUS78216.1 SigE family RNA polymerase sigma factor [Actinoalloteichus sp. AHMU CJ021]MCP2332259.1 RNA polymerase sigma-70 factor, sigma-E family [Actinoalloteichus caeruleus DSM 43889]
MTFDEFVALRLPRLLRYATVLTSDAHLAEDVVQEVLLRAQSRWRRIGRLEAPESYVRKMITNEFLSWRRRRASGEVVTPPDAIGTLRERASREHDDAHARYDERDAMLRRIARLPRKQRAALVLRYYEQLPDREIARLLRCGVGTVRSHVSRALNGLRSEAPAPGTRPALLKEA